MTKMNIAEKSVFVDGNIQNGQITYVCYPINEFSQGKWLIAVNSVTFDSTENISKTCAITCNFVTGQRRTPRGDIEVYEQPLNVFHIKTTPTAARGIFRFCMIKMIQS